jgi:hypothetical protein
MNEMSNACFVTSVGDQKPNVNSQFVSSLFVRVAFEKGRGQAASSFFRLQKKNLATSH